MPSKSYILAGVVGEIGIVAYGINNAHGANAHGAKPEPQGWCIWLDGRLCHTEPEALSRATSAALALGLVG